MTAARDAIKEQFRMWYQHQIPRLFNYVSYWVRDQALAEDITATICERALKNLQRFDPKRASLDTWIFGIARNVLKMHFRGQSRQPVQVSLDSVSEIGSTDSFEDQIEDDERFREILQHFSRLSPQEQEVISLRFGASLSNTQIAKLIGVSANQVGVVLHRGLHKLRLAVSQEEGSRQRNGYP